MKNNYIKTIIGMMILALVISNISALAISMNSGESKVIDFSNEFYSLNGSYSITGNSLNLNGMNITFDGIKVNISLDLGYAPDTFDLTVYGLTKQEVTSYGTSGPVGCLINWSCSDWSQCSNNKTTRTCTKVAPLYCYGEKKPIENKTCAMELTDNVACTADAKICPDGSSVGRIAPNCEFASCPDVVIEKEGLSLFWKIIIGIITFSILCLLLYVIYVYFTEPIQMQENF
jgi:hypothetical protein